MAFLVIVRRQLWETRWPLGLTAFALFWFSWMFVFVTSRTEADIHRALENGDMRARLRFMRSVGGAGMDFSSAAIEMTGWVHPLILLPVIIWAIGRGSAAPAGEIERGTLDLTLSRPATRAAYLWAQVTVAALGLLLLVCALIAGNIVATRYNPIETPPGAFDLARPALNLAMLGLLVYGYTLLFSSCDTVRWRPNLIGSMVTLASFVDYVVVNLPVLEDWSWKPLLEKITFFKAFNPVDAVGKAENLGFNLMILGGTSLAAIIIALLAFQRRDLPSNA